jgi:hypothetical protein
MQTTGAALLAVKRCSLAWVRSVVQDGLISLTWTLADTSQQLHAAPAEAVHVSLCLRNEEITVLHDYRRATFIPRCR